MKNDGEKIADEDISPAEYRKGGSVKYATKGFAKGGYVHDNSDRPRGGPSITERSRFMKTPDTFRTSLQEQDYNKSGKGNKRPSGEGKVIKVET